MVTFSALADMGIQSYDSPLEEAARCRDDSALFDFSFMHRLRISGGFDIAILERLLSRNLSTMTVGDIRYCLYAGANGSVDADLTVWKVSERCFEIFAGRAREVELIAAQIADHCCVEDLSASTSIFAVQGPASLEKLARIGDVSKLTGLSYFQHQGLHLSGVPCLVGRLGYTGEKGFEIIVDDKSLGDDLWQKLVKICKPAGTAAIDILRIEAGFILFLNECRSGCNATELGLAQFANSAPQDCQYQLVGFQASHRNLEMPWSPSIALDLPGEGEISVTSASLSAQCHGVLGLGFVRYPFDFNAAYMDAVNGFEDVELVARPYYDPHKIIPRAAW